MPPPPQMSFDNFRLTRNTDGTFTVGSKFYHKYVVYDDIADGAGDSNTQLGDVSGDHYTQHSEIDPTTFTGTYIGSVNNGGGFVGAYRASYFLYTNNSYSSGQVISANRNQAFAVCYAAGTLIRTERGDVAIDDLAVGDLVLTTSGEARPIRWIGSQTVDCAGHSNPLKAWPVRIAKDTFGENRPARDLYVSPEHSVAVTLVDDVLIPAFCLVNGSTIAYEPRDTVTYWHVELDSHDLLLAENLPAESFLEMGGNRSFFTGRAGIDVLSDEIVNRTHADFCRPFVMDGPLLATARAQLALRAARLGWAPSTAVAVTASAGGASLPVALLGGEALVALSGTACGVILTSDTYVPAHQGEADPRRIGLSIYGITVTDGKGQEHVLDLDDPALAEAFHEGERLQGLHYRCTRGRLSVPPSLLAGLPGPLLMRVGFEPGTVRAWCRKADEDAAGPSTGQEWVDREPGPAHLRLVAA